VASAQQQQQRRSANAQTNRREASRSRHSEAYEKVSAIAKYGERVREAAAQSSTASVVLRKMRDECERRYAKW